MTDFFNSIEDFINNLDEKFSIQGKDVNQMSPLVLAYIGDIVYEIYIRTMIVCNGNEPVNKLHYKSVKYVSAKAQAEIMDSLNGFLNDEELNIVRRGRNSKSGTIPKNANIIEYRYATGFEALMGYLYLKKEYKRLNEVIKRSILTIK